MCSSDLFPSHDTLCIYTLFVLHFCYTFVIHPCEPLLYIGSWLFHRFNFILNLTLILICYTLLYKRRNGRMLTCSTCDTENVNLVLTFVIQGADFCFYFVLTFVIVQCIVLCITDCLRL